MMPEAPAQVQMAAEMAAQTPATEANRTVRPEQQIAAAVAAVVAQMKATAAQAAPVQSSSAQLKPQPQLPDHH
jgi:hypothetical protein